MDTMIQSNGEPLVNVKKNFPVWMIAAMVVTLLPLLSGGIWFYHAEKYAARQQVEKQFTAIAHLKMDQIIAWRNARLDDAAVLTESPFLAQGVARFRVNPNTINTEELRSRFQSIQTHYHYTDILMVAPNGGIILSLSGTTGTLPAYMAALAEALSGRKPVFVDLHAEPQHPAPHTCVVAPIFASDGQA